MATTSSNSGSGRRLELIEYPEGEELVDHKGRSKPIYKPSRPRPHEWRPDAGARLAMGLFPGLRLMVTKSVPAGLPYAMLGLLSSLGALLVIFNWHTTSEALRQLHIQPRWILIRATAVLVLVAVYELLRLGAALEEHPRPRTPRVLSAMVFPAFVVVLGSPGFLHFAPRTLEAVWFAALILSFGALPAAVMCVLDNMTSSHQPRFRRVALTTLLVVVATAVILPLLGVPLFGDLESAMRGAGFRVLPALMP